MSATYGQFCPVAKAMELLDERWTLLIIRELMAGSQHFNALRRGVPRMSPALLSKRMATLIRAGVVERTEVGNRVTYALTPAGRELEPIVEAIGQWGLRWIPELGEQELDPHLLLWDIHRRVDLAAVPHERTTVEFSFTDVPTSQREWWLVITPPEVDVCNVDPGYDVQLAVRTSLRTMVRVWRGDVSLTHVLRSGDLVLDGDSTARRAFPRWLLLSPFASTPRPELAGVAAAPTT
jgi:DNA-binding HxlR family transcriptional regulator